MPYKVAQKLLKFQNVPQKLLQNALQSVAQSCSSFKKLLKFQNVARRLLS